MNRLSTSDRLAQRLLNIIYWLCIGILLGSYAHFACTNRAAVVLNIYDRVEDREKQLKALGFDEDSEEN